jgi:hypothetical protein
MPVQKRHRIWWIVGAVFAALFAVPLLIYNIRSSTKSDIAMVVSFLIICTLPFIYWFKIRKPRNVTDAATTHFDRFDNTR